MYPILEDFLGWGVSEMAVVFISFSAKDSKLASRICQDIEARGHACWISLRDVRPGENYQEAIVSAIQHAKVMVLVFSSNSNISKEIMKELAVASQNGLVVIPARIEDVAPSGAFVFELATRQWIDLFLDWDAAIGRLIERVDTLVAALDNAAPKADALPETSGAAVGTALAASATGPAHEKRSGKALLAVVALAVVLIAGAGAYVWSSSRSTPVASIEQQAARTAAPRSESTPPTRIPAPVRILSATSEMAVPSSPPALDDIGDGGQTFRDCAHCPVMIVIPAGSSLIGSPAVESGHSSLEAPRREVRFARPFAVGREAITFEDWDNCVAEGGCNSFVPGDMGWGRGAQPLVLVSWDDAMSYVGWLTGKTGQTYRLLSESEWEYSARACRSPGCRDSVFWFGNSINPDLANYDWRFSYAGGRKAQALLKPLPANSFGPNGFGLFNMAGNVAQWVADCWHPDLRDLPGDGSPRPGGDCSSHVVRGGSWRDEPLNVRSAARAYDIASAREPNIGFRVARELSR